MSADTLENNPFLEDDNPFLSGPTKSTTSKSSTSYSRPSMSDTRDDNPFLSIPGASKRQIDISNHKGISTLGSANYSNQTSLQPTISFPQLKSSHSPTTSSLLSQNSSHGADIRQHSRTIERSSHRSRSSKSTEAEYRNAGPDDLKQARRELKAWEANFKTTHQRNPTQDDIAKDPIMVKKYRSYAKLKKVLAVNASQEQDSGSTLREAKETTSNSSRTRIKEPKIDVMKTPTKPSRIYDALGLKTPTKKHNPSVEYVSPKNIAGLMSPRRGNKTGEDHLQHIPASISTTPKSPRSKNILFSPSKSSRRRSLACSPGFRSPSSLFTIQEQVKESKSEPSRTFPATPTRSSQISPSGNLFRAGSPSLSRQPGTPTPKRISTAHTLDVFLSPSRLRTSPLFGGMNARRPKRAMKITAPVKEDLEPQLVEHNTVGHQISSSSQLFSPSSIYPKSPLLSTPQKTGAAKAARSLFRRSSINHTSLSSPYQSLNIEEQLAEVGSPIRDRNAGLEYLDMHASQHTSVHEALDSMSISDTDEIRSPSTGRITHGFDVDDNHELDLYMSAQGTPTSSRRLSQGLLSPTATKWQSQISPLRTPSQHSNITFSQPTLGSVTPEAGLWVVPPGFHSLHQRRRQVRPSLFMPSQEESEQFELEFNLRNNRKQNLNDTHNGNSDELNTTLHSKMAPANFASMNAEDDNEDWEEQDSLNESNSTTRLTKSAPLRKKYTQKRSTRLHKIAVAPSQKAKAEAAKAALTKASGKARKTVLAASKVPNPSMIDDTQTTALGTDTSMGVPMDASILEPTMSRAHESIASRTEDPDKLQPFGWANSNKPMVKSDRRIPGIGQGRSGARKQISKFGAPASDGNFVAYNLQRGVSSKRGFRGKSRFNGSKAGGYSGATTGGPGTGRTLFDPDSWRSEYDQDFAENALIMSQADGDLEIDDDDSDIPWYGNVNDITDPYVVTISRKYLKAHTGEEHDPEEYVKELELQTMRERHEDDDYQEFRVNLEYILKKVWGYPSFRDGQLDSIKRTLRYESSLLVLPTGSGKSLSYQLPAYILSKLGIPILTLVISPMISLMYDQVKCLPPGLIGACWTSVEQTTAQFKDFMEKLTSNTIKILFISPEKLQSQSFLSLVRTRRIPPIPFVCVDEVHCLSEWSHNFRPAYLLLNHVLNTDLKSPCVVGLTGTATEGTKDSICAMLDINRNAGVLSGPVIRDNLAMTVSMENDRESALLNLLQSPRFAAMDSILIYVMRQAQADALSAFLRVRNFSAESYHAGKSSQDRQRIQQRFMNDIGPKTGGASGTLISGSSQGGSSGGIRILVATIAFGLGLNKSNIRSVIHYCLPKSLENYIQEIGRSGRDGERSYCHMFLNQDDYMRLRSLAYADGIDWGTVLRLIKKLFSKREIADDTATSKISTAKRRRNLSLADYTDENDGTDEGDLDMFKKRKQNNQRALKVNGGKNESKFHNLVHSTASILAIPPPNGAHSCVVSPSGKRVVVIREELIEEEYDIKKEVLATLLSYIELDDSHPIKVIGPISAKVTVKFLLENEVLSEQADQIPLVDMILKQGVMTGYVNNNGSSAFGRGRKGSSKSGLGGSSLSMAYCCDTVSLCQQSGLSFTELTLELQHWKRKKWALFEMIDPGLCVEILSEPADCMKKLRRDERYASELLATELDIFGVDEGKRKEKDNGCDNGPERDEEAYEKDHDDFVMKLADRLHRKLCAVERVGVAKVDRVYELFRSVATETWQQQEVFKPRLMESLDEDTADNNDDGEDAESDAESSEYDDDVDLEYIETRMKAKLEAKRNRMKPNNNGKAGSGRFKVTYAEQVLREGIQEYFDRRSGEGIGGLHAEDELFCKESAISSSEKSDNELKSTSKTAERLDKTIQLYNYENELVANLQRKWRSAVEVDLKVFLNQQWQQQQQASTDMRLSNKTIDSPRVVCRIFHGISSPCYPILEWRNHRYWGKYMHFDFAQMMQMAARITREQRLQRSQQE